VRDSLSWLWLANKVAGLICHAAALRSFDLTRGGSEQYLRLGIRPLRSHISSKQSPEALTALALVSTTDFISLSAASRLRQGTRSANQSQD
jgi:hypothetical protein